MLLYALAISKIRISFPHDDPGRGSQPWTRLIGCRGYPFGPFAVWPFMARARQRRP
jgi:hypothetical protein